MVCVFNSFLLMQNLTATWCQNVNYTNEQTSQTLGWGLTLRKGRVLLSVSMPCTKVSAYCGPEVSMCKCEDYLWFNLRCPAQTTSRPLPTQARQYLATTPSTLCHTWLSDSALIGGCGGLLTYVCMLVLSYPFTESAMDRRVHIKVNKTQIRSQPLINTTSSTLCQNKSLDSKCTQMYSVPAAGDSEVLLLEVL